MSIGNADFIDQLLALPVDQRGDIASILLRSIDRPVSDTPTSSEVDEIKSRSDQLNGPDAQLIDAADSIAQARAQIAAARKS